MIGQQEIDERFREITGSVVASTSTEDPKLRAYLTELVMGPGMPGEAEQEAVSVHVQTTYGLDQERLEEVFYATQQQIVAELFGK